tara:strand:+ start:197 stop:997 length:801 start_codon:yes stop_codon:yes gene_type:complete
MTIAISETVVVQAIPDEMNEQEALQAVSDIKKNINTVRARIYDLDRRKGWKALGYRSFASCCIDQFPELHAKYVEKQLAAARVDAVLKEFPPKGGKIQELPERHARELVSLRHDPEALKNAYEKALDIAEVKNNGKVTTEIISQAVKQSTPEYEWSEDELNRRAIVEAGGTVVANMHQDTDRALLNWARQTGRFLRIDRQSDWGNPFEMGEDGDRDTVCDSYEIFFPRKFSLHNRLDELRGKVLGCWCYPARCHGMYLIAAIENND